MNHSKKHPLRCAIYTRKSSDEGLDREFNSLDAQREAGESYIASQKDQGWILVPQRYDDGGYSGGNMERPALRRLLADIADERIDCVIVYKLDRLSRSLLDFASLMALFEKHRVAFVAVTQEFNTASSMGRLMLHILLSFAQFERELISERTRDKMAAARRKGKWLGSTPVLGYDADREKRKLVANAAEAQQVREIFHLYAASGSLRETVQELHRRRWVNKQWTTQNGKLRGGRPFTKASLQYLLTNVTYLGQVKYKGEIYAGEQPGLVSRRLFRQVQRLLKQNRRGRPRHDGEKLAGLLQGKLFCAGCRCRMIHTYTAKGSRRYRYYVCSHAQQYGCQQCGTRSLPAAEFERYVCGEIREHLNGDQGRLTQAELATLVERIEYDGRLGELEIQFQSTGEAKGTR